VLRAVRQGRLGELRVRESVARILALKAGAPPPSSNE
jgi:hypothetical protein